MVNEKMVSSGLNIARKKYEGWLIAVVTVINFSLVAYERMQYWVWATGQTGLVRKIFRPVEDVGDNPMGSATREDFIFLAIGSWLFLGVLCMALRWRRAGLTFLLSVPVYYCIAYLVRVAL